MEHSTASFSEHRGVPTTQLSSTSSRVLIPRTSALQQNSLSTKWVLNNYLVDDWIYTDIFPHGAPYQNSPLSFVSPFSVLEISICLTRTVTKETSVFGGLRRCMNQKRGCIQLSRNSQLMDSMFCSGFFWFCFCFCFLKLAVVCGGEVQRCLVLGKCSVTKQAQLSSYFNQGQSSEQDSKPARRCITSWLPEAF